jgi:hypothetical protein
MDTVLAPDILVNASVALGSEPEKVVRTVLGQHKGQSATSEWVLARVEAMLGAIPEFKKEAIDQQLAIIREHTRLVEVEGHFDADDWERALVALAKEADATRVITDHPDLLAKESVSKIEFISSEAWMIEQAMPPPPPV